MRIFFLLLFILIASFTVLSQDGKLPSKTEIQAQMKEAKLELQQQILDLEKQIAEAKKNNENPETIKELEDQLALLRKMSGTVGKIETINRTPPKELPTTNTIAPYKSPYIHFFNQVVATPTEAQAKDRLLWYRGKKIDKNTLITTKGRVVRYDRQNNLVLVQYNEKKDTNTIKLIANLKKSRQWTNKYVNEKSAEKNSFFDYPMVMMVMKEYDLIEKEFDKIANNTLELPGTGTNPRAGIFYESSNSNSGPSDNYQFNSDASNDPWLDQQYQEIMSRVNNPPPLDVYPPPKEEFSLCYYCDISALEKYEREKEIWSNGFNEYEVGIISRCLSIYRYFSLLKGDDYEDLMDPGMLADLKKAEKFAQDRMEKKIEILQQRYGEDIYRYTAVISSVLGWERQKELLGVSDNAPPPEFEIFKDQTFIQFINDRIAANDYDVIFNYAMILGFARQKALLSYVDDEHDTYEPMIEAVVNHNRFALTVDLDFELDWGEGEDALQKAFGTLTTKQKTYVKLGRNQNCKWQFYLFDADYSLMTQENDYKIPLIVTSGTKMIKHPNSGWETYSYSGPKDLLMIFPSFRMSFCNGSNQDSAMIDLLRYEQEDLSMYKIEKNYTVDLLAYVNKMLVGLEKIRDNQSNITDIIDKMVDVSSNRGTVDNPTGYPKLDKMQMEFKTNGIQHDLQKQTTEVSKVENTVILFDAQNGSPVLINSSTNTANTELGGVILRKGLIKLKVVLEPL